MRVAIGLFFLGLLLRVLFVLAGPDGGAAWHIGFKGDAPVWQDLAARLATGTPDAELRLPWRSPGMLWLVSLLWDGQGSAWLPRVVCLVAGAMVAPLLWLLLRPVTSVATAIVAAGICAVSSNMLLICSGVHVEAPYLALVLWTLCDQQRLPSAGPWLPLRWGAVHGLLCLLRAEHLLSFALLLLVGRAAGARWRALGVAVLACAAVLLPWQFVAASKVAAFNTESPPRVTLSLPWDDAAAARVEALPAFVQADVFELVDATVRHRGGGRVTVADLAIVEEAYGAWPAPLPYPVIALNGPVNFWLANTPEAYAGTHWDAMQRPPPLADGGERFPPALVARAGEPRGFTLGYPPHLDRVLHGYSHGIDEMLADPAAAAARVLGKLARGVEGATGGIGGYALPVGLSGVRHQTDLTQASGDAGSVWSALVLAVAALGLWRLRRERRLWPLAAFAASKVVIIAAFFGYARHGALCLPLVAVGVGATWSLCAERVRLLRSPWLGAAFAVVIVVVDATRLAGVGATVDGRPAVAGEPFPPNEYAPRTIEFHRR